LGIDFLRFYPRGEERKVKQYLLVKTFFDLIAENGEIIMEIITKRHQSPGVSGNRYI